MGDTDRLRRGEAGGIRRRSASPAPPPDLCSNICSTLLQGSLLSLGSVKWQFRKVASLGLRRGLIDVVQPANVAALAETRPTQADTGTRP
jgi:hypothetical protein